MLAGIAKEEGREEAAAQIFAISNLSKTNRSGDD
jgi:hypothetical protein